MQIYDIHFTATFGNGVDRISSSDILGIPADSEVRARTRFLELTSNSLGLIANRTIWPVKEGARLVINKVEVRTSTINVDVPEVLEPTIPIEATKPVKKSALNKKSGKKKKG